jgi:hypothetical protein
MTLFSFVLTQVYSFFYVEARAIPPFWTLILNPYRHRMLGDMPQFLPMHPNYETHHRLADATQRNIAIIAHSTNPTRQFIPQ